MMFLILIQSMGCKSEVKSPRAVKRCGYEFISTYIYCCQYKNYCRRMEKGDVTGKKIMLFSPLPPPKSKRAQR